MTDKEKLYYLVKEYIKGNYTTEMFCDLFTVQYNIETDYSILNETEYKCFKELSNITARFSSSEEELRIPHLYFNEFQIKDKVQEVVTILCIQL